MLRACLHHGFIKLAKIDTFYNGLNDNDQDSLNAAASGNLLRIMLVSQMIGLISVVPEIRIYYLEISANSSAGATHQLSSGNTSSLAAAKYTSSGIFITGSLDKMVLSDAPVSVTKGFLFWRSTEGVLSKTYPSWEESRLEQEGGTAL
nr:reverse transcriptase domain-containing protein [Tanacetum cinerariifolium]